jgi:hypothetical protein
MKKLPLGIQTFSDMINENHYYVDKTEFVQKLANIGRYFFLSRPRRFGKSSFLDTLHEAYEGNQELFKGLFLEKNWDWSKKYPVIKISFGSGIMQSKIDVLEKIRGILTENQEILEIQCNDSNPANCLSQLIRYTYQKYNSKVVILIDEYDKPILDNIEKSILPYKIREVLKGFYSVIKDSDKYIQFVFITGVSKFSKVNLFSGLNNLTDITLDPEFATICGYTKREINHTFQDILTDLPMDELKEWYDGYNFLGEKVYNPYDVLYYLKNKVFKNYWFETGTPSFLIKLIEKRKFPIPDLETIELTESVLNSFDINSIQLETLLFQTGYLTIKSIERLGPTIIYHLCYPNLEVKHSLNDYILKYLSNQSMEKEKNKSKLYRILYAGEVAKLKDLFHAFFASIPYNWYTNNNIANYEGFYASVFYTYFTAIGVEVKVEDATNHGRIDMVAILNSRCYVLEFKVNELTPEGKAMEQLKERGYHEKYVGYESKHLGSGTVKEIYLVGVEFSKTNRNITAFDWEKVDSSCNE